MKKFDLQTLMNDLQTLVQQAKYELAEAHDAKEIDNVHAKYVGEQGMISQCLNSPIMNTRWASWRRYRFAICKADTAVQVAIEEKRAEVKR